MTGDQEGLLEEVRRQVGDEAEFNRLNVIQRKALADAFGFGDEGGGDDEGKDIPSGYLSNFGKPSLA